MGSRSWRMAAALLVALALVACSGGAGRSRVTAQSLAQRLERAGVCTHAQPTPTQAEAISKQLGMTKTWQCDAPSPDNGAHGGIEVGLWAGTTVADRRRVLATMQRLLDGFCTSTASLSSNSGFRGPIEPAPADAPERTRVTEQYVEGDTWLALVGINARFHDVASTLDGHAVTKHCTKP